ncbi:MAG: radical SAM protein [Deltaproteobacteria bacterium]|nr:radical SAM protein [Deltaproteobacteria bacterium]
MGTCRLCGENRPTISEVIGFCVRCIRTDFARIRPELNRVHQHSRLPYGLPSEPPRAADGFTCKLCLHSCSIPEGGRGYCGLRHVTKGILRGGRPHEGRLSFYFDPLPTNCVASFTCAAGTGCGYPEYAVSKGPEHGYRNLAVFYEACSFNCLFCQNYHFKQRTSSAGNVHARNLAAAVDDRTTCICYFGGDPSPQVLHAIKASSLAIQRAQGRVLRVCWETNGCVQQPYLDKMALLSLHSGGCIKIDLKAWDSGVHFALCGVNNHKTLENFATLSKLIPERRMPPFLIASTLLVPGYVDEVEVAAIADFLVRLDPEIPYSLLAFYPTFYLGDLPTTSRTHALRCKQAAEQAGLKQVHIGNVHLLGKDYW